MHHHHHHHHQNSAQPGKSLGAALEQNRTRKSDAPILKNQMLYSHSANAQRSVPRPQPGWVAGSFTPVSADLGPPQKEAYATRAENLSLRPTSNALMGVPLRNTKSPSQFSSTNRDLQPHEREAYVQRAPNYSLRPTSNDIFGVPLRDSLSPSQFSSTHHDMQPHERSAYVQRAPNYSLHPGTACIAYHDS